MSTDFATSSFHPSFVFDVFFLAELYRVKGMTSRENPWSVRVIHLAIRTLGVYARMYDPDYRQRLAYGVFKGIVAFDPQP